MAQGIEWDKDRIIEALKPYLQLGYSVHMSCTLAQIPTSTVATWMEKDESLRKQFKAWQNLVSASARKVVVDKINEGDDKQANWWLERREKKDFSSRQELTGKDGTDLIKVDDQSKEKTDKALNEFLNNKDTGSGITPREEVIVPILREGL